MSTPAVTNITIIGANGNIGRPMLKHLLASPHPFNITIITRTNNNQFPSSPRIRVVAGDYSSPSFLASAFANQHAAILLVGFQASPETGLSLIEAAAAAGVEYIFPTEFGSDNAKPYFDALPIVAHKRGARARVEELGKKWIGVVTNPWLGFGLYAGMWQLDWKERTATVFDGGNTKFSTTNLDTVGLAIARLLGLPKEKLDAHANQFVYIASHHITQKELIAAVQRATGTKPEEWEVRDESLNAFIEEGKAKLAKGDYSGVRALLMGGVLAEGGGGDYHDKIANKELGLPEEDLDEAVKYALDHPEEFDIVMPGK